jgi:hypothetical protein
MVTIESDARHPGMWRVRYPDGRLSDMVNLTRAKNAAVSIALSLLNGQRNSDEHVRHAIAA